MQCKKNNFSKNEAALGAMIKSLERIANVWDDRIIHPQLTDIKKIVLCNIFIKWKVSILIQK